MRLSRAALVSTIFSTICCIALHPALAQPPASAPQSTLSFEELVARGDSAWGAGDHARARGAYQQAVDRSPEGSSRAVFRLATLLSYDNQLSQAIGLFKRYIQLEPRDDAGRLALARTMAWAGRYDDAIAVYDTILTRNPDDSDAAKGIARVLGWRGELAHSEERWRALTRRTPQDPEAWVGLAQVLRWSGQPVAARSALREAMAADSNYEDARTQLRWVNAELAPTLRVDIIPSNDSDHNRAIWYATSVGIRPPWNGRVTVIGGGRTASFQALDARSFGVRVRSHWLLNQGRLTVSGELGGTHLSGKANAIRQSISSPTRLIASAGLYSQVSSRLSGGVSISRSPFDETAALIVSGITTTSANADASITLPARFALDLGAGFTKLTGGNTPNNRRSGLASLRYTVSRQLSIAATARGFGYDTAATDGYFSPEQYFLVESSVRGRLGGDLGWRASGDAGLGSQQVRLRGTSTSRAATRASLEVGYQFAPGYGVGLTGTLANLPSTNTLAPDGYRWYSVALSAQILVR